MPTHAYVRLLRHVEQHHGMDGDPRTCFHDQQQQQKAKAEAEAEAYDKNTHLVPPAIII